MKRLETILIFLLLYTIFACTEKKNTLGFNEEITPLDSLTINLDISDAYSFNDYPNRNSLFAHFIGRQKGKKAGCVRKCNCGRCWGDLYVNYYP